MRKVLTLALVLVLVAAVATRLHRQHRLFALRAPAHCASSRVGLQAPLLQGWLNHVLGSVSVLPDPLVNCTNSPDHREVGHRETMAPSSEIRWPGHDSD